MRSPFVACPGILGGGGIATYARQVTQALAPEPVLAMGLGEVDRTYVLGSNVKLRAAPDSQLGFALRFGAEYLRPLPRVFVLAHLGLAAPLGVQPRSRRHRVVLMLHGIEAWTRLSGKRAIGLGHIDTFVYTTRYTRDVFLNWNQDQLSKDSEHLVIPLSAGPEVEARALQPVLGTPRRRVVCVTRLTADEPLKGVDTLVRSAVHLDAGRYEIVIVGNGSGKPRFEALARECGVSDRVTFTGFLPAEQRDALISEADVFCLPSAQEGFGIVFLEAMALGRPCLGAAAGAVPEVLPTQVAETVPYGDERALAQAIENLASRFRAGEIRPETVRRAYLERFSWDSFAGSWRAAMTRWCGT